MFFDFGVGRKTFAISSESNENVEQELTDKIDEILKDIDSSDLDVFLNNDAGLEFLDKNTFKDFAVAVLSGEYFSEYNSLFDFIVSIIKNNFKEILSFIVSILALIILYEVFKTFCSEKFLDVKKAVGIIFSMLIVLMLAGVMKNIADSLSETIHKIFNFSKLLFPILLNLILLSGSAGMFSVYSTMSAFLLNTGSYIFVYVLFPMSVSILVLSLAGSIFGEKKFSKVIDIFKTLFKYIVMLVFGVFGIFSVLNLMTSGARDGVGLKLTKYAIKNYIPILGGYISEGFDFVHACSVLVKNAFGFCGVVVLLFIVLKPLLVYFVYLISFKILSVLVSYVSAESKFDMFDNISKCMGYFIAILVGVFLIMFVFLYLMIMSISVVWNVWCYFNCDCVKFDFWNGWDFVSCKKNEGCS